MSAKVRYLKLVERLPRASAAQNAESMSVKQREDFLRRFVNATTTAIEEGLARDGNVRIHQFGTFQLQWVNEREGRKPGTSERFSIPGHYRVVFRPYKKLEDRVNAVFSHLRPVILTPKPRVSGPAGDAIALPLPQLEPDETFDISEQFDFESVLEEALSGKKTEVNDGLQLHFADQAEESEPGLGEASEEPLGQSEVGTGQDFESESTAIVVGEAEPERLPASEQESAPTRRLPPRIRWYDGVMVMLALLFLLMFSALDQSQRGSSEVGEKAVAVQPAADSAGNNHETDDSGALAESSTKEPVSVAEPAAPFFVGGVHKVAAGDNLWELSARYYLDSYLWPNIYRVNTDKIKDPDLLTPEQLLRLPVLHGDHAHLTEEDRHNLAEGYFLLFKYYKRVRTHLAPFALWASVKFDRGILDAHAEEIGEDELAFLSAHNIETVATR